MADTVIVSPTSDPLELWSESGSGVLWRCLARRGMVFSEIEGFEFARIPPGGVIAEHGHPHTEEITYVVSGRGRATLDGEELDLVSGDLLTVRTGSTHSLMNSGDDQLDVLMLEFVPEAVANMLPTRTPQLVEGQ